MLVLTRKCQEKIRIGDNITITVFRINGKAVRLGIEAPPNMRVLRGELVFDDAIQPSRKLEPNALHAAVLNEHTHAHSAPMTTSSPIGTRSVRMDPRSPSEVEQLVELIRLPRNEVSGIMPRLISSNALS